jgi:ABC-type transport system involved in cytochrome bd biosynthesis fused ATPase/permease subunit
LLYIGQFFTQNHLTMKKKIVFTLLWLGLLLGQTFAATVSKPTARQQQEAEAAKAQIEQLMQSQAATAAQTDKHKFRMIEKARQQMDKLANKIRKIKRPIDDLSGLLTTIGIILIIIGLVGIILGLLGIGGGYPAGGGALFLGLVLYLIGKYVL